MGLGELGLRMASYSLKGEVFGPCSIQNTFFFPQALSLLGEMTGRSARAPRQKVAMQQIRASLLFSFFLSQPSAQAYSKHQHEI